MAPNSPLPAHFSFIALRLSKNALVVGKSNFSMLTAPIILCGAFDHTSGLLRTLFMPPYVVHGSSAQVVVVFPLCSTGFNASNFLIQFSASGSAPDHTRLTRIRFCGGCQLGFLAFISRDSKPFVPIYSAGSTRQRLPALAA